MTHSYHAQCLALIEVGCKGACVAAWMGLNSPCQHAETRRNLGRSAGDRSEADSAKTVARKLSPAPSPQPTTTASAPSPHQPVVVSGSPLPGFGIYGLPLQRSWEPARPVSGEPKKPRMSTEEGGSQKPKGTSSGKQSVPKQKITASKNSAKPTATSKPKSSSEGSAKRTTDATSSVARAPEDIAKQTASPEDGESAPGSAMQSPLEALAHAAESANQASGGEGSATVQEHGNQPPIGEDQSNAGLNVKESEVALMDDPREVASSDTQPSPIAGGQSEAPFSEMPPNGGSSSREAPRPATPVEGT
jgi:hypothetical protein